jgi:hypothetical protein
MHAMPLVLQGNMGSLQQQTQHSNIVHSQVFLVAAE